jgi:acyl carrier protein
MNHQLEAIYIEVRRLILEVLQRPDAECGLSTPLISGLGAEPLDFVDFTLRIERRFQVKLDRTWLEKALRRPPPHAARLHGDERRASLAELMPELRAEQLASPDKLGSLVELATIATFVRLTVQAICRAQLDAGISAQPLFGYSPQQLGVPLRDEV